MKKILTWLVVSLCTLLLDGLDQLAAHSLENCAPDSSVHYCKASENGTFPIIIQDSEASAAPLFSCDTERLISNVDVAEIVEAQEEEHEGSSFKKHLKKNNYPTSILLAQTLGFVYRYTKKSVPFCKHFSYLSPYRWFLIFRVIRI